MSTKKRKADPMEQAEVLPLKDGTTSHRPRKKASSPKAKMLKEVASSSHEQECLSFYQSEIVKLNTVTKDRLETSKTPEEAVMVVCEHLRCQKDIQDRYQRPRGDVVVMGSDDCNQLGLLVTDDELKKDEYPPTVLTSLPKGRVVQVAAGGLHSLALMAHGRVFSWGCNDDTALGRGNGSERPEEITQTFLEDRIIAINAGDSHSLFLSLSGNVYSCGMYKDVDSGKFRDIPRGDKLTKKGSNARPVLVQLPKKAKSAVAGFSWNAAILEDDSLVTWGMGHSGQLARSKTMGAPQIKDGEGRDTFELGKTWIGKEVHEKEWNKEEKRFEEVSVYRYDLDLIERTFLTPAPPLWSTPGQKQVLSVACGELHILVIARTDGMPETEVYSAGQNQYGQLGHGDNVLQRHELTLIEAFKGKEITQVAAGAQFSMACNTLGNAVYTWGRSDYGQLGLYEKSQSSGSFESTPKQVAFPEDIKDTRVREIVAGERVAFAVMDDYQVYAWGYNDTGATGHSSAQEGDDVNRPKRLRVMRKYAKRAGPKNAHVSNVSGGGQHSLMVIQKFA